MAGSGWVLMDFAEAYLLTKLGHPELAGWWEKLLGGDAKTQYDFTAKQTGEGDPAPDNERPILPGLVLTRDDGSTLEVYGGTLDVPTGVLTVKWRHVQLKSSMSWSNYKSGFYPSASNMPGIAVSYDGDNTIYRTQSKCNLLSTILSEPTGVVGWFPGSPTPRFHAPGVTSTMQWKNWLDNHPLYFVYPINPFVTHNLTPQEVKRAVSALRH